jgi:hypothetical protein
LWQISTPHPNHGKKNGALKLHLDAKIGITITTTTTTRSVSHYGLAIYIKNVSSKNPHIKKQIDLLFLLLTSRSQNHLS